MKWRIGSPLARQARACRRAGSQGSAARGSPGRGSSAGSRSARTRRTGARTASQRGRPRVPATRPRRSARPRPRPRGRGRSAHSPRGRRPEAVYMSVWQTPHATRRTSTSPGPGSASSTSCTTSGFANSSRTAARIFIGRLRLCSCRCAGQQALLARERLTGGREDLDVGQLAGRRKAREVDRLVMARASAQALGVGARGPSTRTSTVRPTKRCARSRALSLNELHQPLHPLHLDLVRHHAVGERRRLGAAPRREDEREGAVVADLPRPLRASLRSPPRSRRGTPR